MIFYWIVKKILHFFMQKTELIYRKNCQFHSDLLLELFKNGKFFQKSYLKNFSIFFFFRLSREPFNIF